MTDNNDKGVTSTVDNNQIFIDFSDIDQLREIMDEHGDIGQMVFGKNPDTGEDQTIHISHGNIILETNQSNGWVRKNTYWYDGDVEETFVGRWR